MFRFDFQHPDPDPEEISIFLDYSDRAPHQAVKTQQAATTSLTKHYLGAPSSFISPTHLRDSPSLQPLRQPIHLTNNLPRIMNRHLAPPDDQVAGALTTQAQQPTCLPSRAAHTYRQPANLHIICLVDLTPNPHLLSSTLMDTDEKTDTDIITLLDSVYPDLDKLRATTLPPFSSHVQSKSSAEVLKERLVPVGQHVVDVLTQMEAGRADGMEAEEEGADGGMELDVW